MCNMVATQRQTKNVWGRREQVNGKGLSVHFHCLGCIETANGILELQTGMPKGILN